MAMSPKEALIKDGRIPVKAGRGRLSREADARVRELVAQGWSVKGYEANTSTKSVVTPGAPAAQVESSVKKIVQTNEKVIQEFTLLYDERAYDAKDATGKVWSMRNVCNNCRVSLVQCHCGNPSIFGDIGVTIVPSG